MGWVKKTVTGREIYEAIEQDEFGTLRGEWFEKGAKGVSACLLGGAGLNLGVYANSTQADAADENNRIGLLEVLDLETVPENSRWFSYDDEGIASTIIRLYDKTVHSDYIRDLGHNLSDYEPAPSFGANQYYYLTYAQSLEMAKDLLTPVWDKSFTVDVFDYSTWDYVQDDTTTYEYEYEEDDDPYGDY